MSTSPSLSPSPRSSRPKSSRRSSAPQAPDSLPPVASPPVLEPESRAPTGFFERIFGIDVRTLALFRMALAFMLVDDLRVRLPDIGAFYTDDGVLPRSAFIELYTNSTPNLLSLHLLSGLWGYQALLFVLAAACAACMFVGYRTRLFTFLSWVLLISMQNRNPVILHGGDTVMRLLMFWGVFLPLGRVWSLDALISPDATTRSDSDAATKAPAASRILSAGSCAALLQMCFIYWFAYTLKSDPVWRSEGTALFYALSLDQLVKPLGLAMLPHAGLLKFLTHVTMAIELCGPTVALLPWWQSRLVMVVVFIGFHTMLGLCLTLGLFPYAAAIGWLLFIPSEFWEIVGRRYAAMSDNAFKTRIEAVRAKFHPVKAALIALRPAAPQASPLEAVSPRAGAAVKWMGTKGLQGVAALMLLYVLAFNVRSTDLERFDKVLPYQLDWIAEATRTDQTWGMFAPKPLQEDGWYIIPGKLADGRTVDLFHDGADVSWEKPVLLSSQYKNERWQKYTLNLYTRGDRPNLPYYAAYLKRHWDATHPFEERVDSLEIIYMREDSIPGRTDVKPKKKVLWPFPPPRKTNVNTNVITNVTPPSDTVIDPFANMPQ